LIEKKIKDKEKKALLLNSGEEYSKNPTFFRVFFFFFVNITFPSAPFFPHDFHTNDDYSQQEILVSPYPRENVQRINPSAYLKLSFIMDPS
jgi:hypothetical protein